MKWLVFELLELDLEWENTKRLVKIRMKHTYIYKKRTHGALRKIKIKRRLCK